MEGAGSERYRREQGGRAPHGRWTGDTTRLIFAQGDVRHQPAFGDDAVRVPGGTDREAGEGRREGMWEGGGEREDQVVCHDEWTYTGTDGEVL